MKVLVPLPIDLSVMANGRTLRVVHLLRELNRGCDLVCLVPGDHRAEAARRALPNLHIESPDTGSTARGSEWPRDLLPLDAISRRILSFIGFDQPAMRATVRMAPKFDTVFGFDTVSLAYLLAVEHARVGRRPRLLADMIDDPWNIHKSMSFATRYSPSGLKHAMALHWLRSRLLGRLDACVAVATRDAESLAASARLKVEVVPNGVVVPENRCLDGARENLLVFTGAMQFPPNVTAACWFARRVWPRIWDAMGGRQARRSNAPDPVQFAIVGTSPTSRVRKLAEQPGIVVTGAVEDMGSWLGKARLAIAPMVTGSGIKNKILEAAAAGCPVVSTSLGAAGLPTGEANGSLVADAPAAFAEKVVALLQNPAMARTIGYAGRAMVSTQYTWPRMAQRLLKVLRGPGSCDDSSPHRPAPALDPMQPVPDSDSLPTCEKEALTHAAS